MNSVFIKEKLDKSNIKFENFVAKAAEIEADRADFYVHDVAKNLWMDENDGTISFCHSIGGKPETENYPATGWALSQLSVKLGMPSGYAEKCIERGHPDLAANNVNTWLTEQTGSKR